MKNQYNILVPLFIGCLLLTGIFFLRTEGVDNMKKELTKCVKKLVYNNTSLKNLRIKSIEALDKYTKDHIKMTERPKDNRRAELNISYELTKLEDMYAWFRLASNNAKPEIQQTLLSNNKKYTTFAVQDNGTDNTGSFYIILKVFDRSNNSGLIGILTYTNSEWNPEKNLYDISKVIIDLYVPDSDFFRDY